MSDNWIVQNLENALEVIKSPEDVKAEYAEMVRTAAEALSE